MEKDFGTVTYNGQEIKLLEQAYATSRLMNEYPNELQYQGDGDTFMSEYAASGVTADGKKVKVFWHFEIEKEDRAGTPKGDGVYFYDTLEENYDWDNVHSVKDDE